MPVAIANWWSGLFSWDLTSSVREGQVEKGAFNLEQVVKGFRVFVVAFQRRGVHLRLLCPFPNTAQSERPCTTQSLTLPWSWLKLCIKKAMKGTQPDFQSHLSLGLHVSAMPDSSVFLVDVATTHLTWEGCPVLVSLWCHNGPPPALALTRALELWAGLPGPYIPTQARRLSVTLELEGILLQGVEKMSNVQLDLRMFGKEGGGERGNSYSTF